VAVKRSVTTTGKVQPADTRATVLEEQLVEVQVIHDILIPAAPRLYVWQVDVGSLATQVLRVPHSMHRLVQFLASVAAIDVYRFALMVAQGLQHLSAQVPQVDDSLPVRSVVNAQALGRRTLNKLFQSEVLRQLHLRIILRFVHYKEILCFS